MAAIRSSRAAQSHQDYDLLSFLFADGCEDAEDTSNPAAVKFTHLSSLNGAPSTAFNNAQDVTGDALLCDKVQFYSEAVLLRPTSLAAQATSNRAADNNGPAACAASELASMADAAGSMTTTITAPDASARTNSSRSPIRNGDLHLNQTCPQALIGNIPQTESSWCQQFPNQVNPTLAPSSIAPSQGAAGASFFGLGQGRRLDDFQQPMSGGPGSGAADSTATGSPVATVAPAEADTGPYARPLRNSSGAPSAAAPSQHPQNGPCFQPYSVQPARPPGSCAPPAWPHRGMAAYRPPSAAGTAASTSAELTSIGAHVRFDATSSAFPAAPPYAEYGEHHTSQPGLMPSSSPDGQQGPGAQHALAQAAATSSSSPVGREAVSGIQAADGPPPTMGPLPHMASSVGGRAPYGYPGSWGSPKAFTANGPDSAPPKSSMLPSSSGGLPLENPPPVHTASYHHPSYPPPHHPHRHPHAHYPHPHYHRLHVPKRYAWPDGYGMAPGYMPYWTMPYPHIPVCRAASWHHGFAANAGTAPASSAAGAPEGSSRTDVSAGLPYNGGQENVALGTGGVMRTTAPGRRPVHHPYSDFPAELYGDSGIVGAPSHRNPYRRPGGTVPMMYGSPHAPYSRPASAVAAAAAAGKVLRSASLDSLLVLPSARELQQAARAAHPMMHGVEGDVIYEHTVSAEGEAPPQPQPPPQLEHADSFKRRKLSCTWSLPQPVCGGGGGGAEHATAPAAASQDLLPPMGPYSELSSRHSTPRDAPPQPAMVGPGAFPSMYDMRPDGLAQLPPLASLPSAFHTQARIKRESPQSSGAAGGAPSSPDTGIAQPPPPPAHLGGGPLSGVPGTGDDLVQHLGDLDESFEALGIKLGLDDLDLCMAGHDGEIVAATIDGAAHHHHGPPPPLQALSQPQLPTGTCPAPAVGRPGTVAGAVTAANSTVTAEAMDPTLAAASAAASAAVAAAAAAAVASNAIDAAFFTAPDGSASAAQQLWASQVAVQPPQHPPLQQQAQEHQLQPAVGSGYCLPAGAADGAASDSEVTQQPQQLCSGALMAEGAGMLQAPPSLMPTLPSTGSLPSTSAAALPSARRGEEPRAAAATASPPPPLHGAVFESAQPPAARPRGTSQRRLNGNSSRNVRTTHPLLQSGAEDRLPGPVRVTVAGGGGGGGGRSCGGRSGGGRGGSDGGAASSEDEGSADGSSGAGSKVSGVMGLFYVKPYLEGRKCIEHCGEMVSRSAFERVGGSMMAKWYRSIKVLPDGLSLGKWLVNNGLPVLKGNPRRSKKNAHPTDGDAS